MPDWGQSDLVDTFGAGDQVNPALSSFGADDLPNAFGMNDAPTPRPSLGRRFLEHAKEGFSNTIAGQGVLNAQSGEIDKRQADLLESIIANARQQGSAVGVPLPPVTDKTTGAALSDPNRDAAGLVGDYVGVPLADLEHKAKSARARYNVQSRPVLEAERQRQAEFQAMPPAQGILERGAAVAGALAGSAPTPESVVPVGRGASLVGTAAKGFAAGAVASGISDPIIQQSQIAKGLREQYDPGQTVTSIIAGGAIAGTLNVAPDVVMALVRETARRLGKPEAAVTVGDLAAPTPEARQTAVGGTSAPTAVTTPEGQVANPEAAGAVGESVFGAGDVRVAPESFGAADALTPPLTEPRIEQGLQRKVVDAASDLLTAGKVKRDPSRLISDQVAELLSTSRITTPELDAVLTRHGVAPDEFSSLWRVNIKKAAQDMQTLSALEQRLKALAKEAGAEKDLAHMQAAAGFDVDTRALGFWRRLDGVRRGLLVGQLATAVRNVESQVGRVGIDVLQQGLDNALGRAFGLPGAKQVSPLKAFSALVKVFRPLKTRREVDAVLDRFPAEQDVLFARYSSDLNRKGGGGLMGAAEKGVAIINTANRMQEFVVRRAVFQASLERNLARQGMDLPTLVRENRIGSIPRDTIKQAVGDSLEATFGKNFSPFARGAEGIAGSLIRAVTNTPLSLIVPFPRFMFNAWRFMFQFSPAGFLRLLSPTERARIAAGDTSAISRAVIGTTMLLAAYQVRQSEYAGEKWYEIRLPDGRTIDARPFAPFSAYLFVAEMLNPNRKTPMTAKDILQGVFSINLRAGVGLYAVDKVIAAIDGVGNAEKAAQLAGTAAGEVLAGFLVPLQTVKDFIAEFDKSERVVRSGEEDGLLGPVMRMIPGVQTMLPPVESPTRDANIEREEPALRQLTGLSVSSPKNAAEKELDRLGFSRSEILPSEGDPKANRLIAKHLGPLVESKLVPLVNGKKYQNADDALKAYMLSEALKRLRSSAKDMAKRDDPALFRKLKVENQPKRRRAVIKSKQEN